ncbi:UNVERIFIED_CONTAM: hypothetical protein K2H54_074739 [Gekko kuhli]
MFRHGIKPCIAFVSVQLGQGREEGVANAGLLTWSLVTNNHTAVSAVPTVLALKNGNVVDKFVGIKDEDQLEAFLKKLIGP